MKNLAIFASGKGSNTENMIRYFQDSELAKVVIVFSDNADAEVLVKAKTMGVPARSFTRDEFFFSDAVLNRLKELKIDWIILAGFLKLVPEKIIQHFPKHIINIHPALLPKFGGKGMHGRYVHEAVCKAGEKETGITIHYVNERFDEGEIIFQKKVPINVNETTESVAQKVRVLELEYYPKVIEKLVAEN